ncbi:DUF937 domain-containing protein [Erythrobacteraceae bacterium CFH 75059]|uniref:DUF937 domain-containing protein n=1 Tax=Qipengyuania thermophila TaxID=2509361 RepID=UPI001020278A|nr:DUF937 domain-containing protein [Qipengyuania thermophila]TCD02271.1 DUF937 domain-containing protein [Erythrobacteraceae bacterium CFH 75059]
MSLAQSLLNSPVVPSMARELGIDEQTARSGAAALLPAIVAGLGRSAAGGAGAAASPAGPGGLGGLSAILGGFGGGGGLLDAVTGAQPTPVQQGNDILGSIFGSKDVSRSVTQEASAVSGLDQTLLKKMLPILAMAAIGMLMQQGGRQQPGSGSGAAGAGLGGILGAVVKGLAR